MSQIQIMAGSGTAVTGCKGNDTFRAWGKTNNMKVDLGTGNDKLIVNGCQNMELKGGEGYDTFEVSGQNIFMEGGAGNDTYVLTKLAENEVYTISQAQAGRYDKDVLQLAKYSRSEFELSLSNEMLRLTHTITGAQILVENWDQKALTEIRFADGTVAGNSL